MIGLNEQPPANETAAAAEPAVNGTAPQGPPAPEAAATQGEDAADRAEAVVEGIAQRVGYFASWGTRKLVSLASRTREALQDFWADVQDFRHGRNTAAPPDSQPEPADDGTAR